jgi:hypothetical protein
MDLSRMAKELGRRGGLARARRLESRERKRIAALGGLARRESLLAARRIAENFRYVEALRGIQPLVPVKRLRSFPGPLPDLQRSR